MKKTIFIVIGVMLFLAQFQTGKVFAQEDTNTKQKVQHIKPASTLTREQVARTKQNSANSSIEKETTKASDSTGSSASTKNLQQFSAQDNKLTPLSTETPTLLDMNYYYPQIIAAAVAKNHRNIQSTRNGGYGPLNYYYDNLGNLDYVTNSLGVVVGDVYYCDGSEAYNCPVGWLDYINLNPTGAPANLEFNYYQDTPTTNYYASFNNEPSLWIFNIDTARGTSVSNLSDPLYEVDGYPTIEYYMHAITGYVEGDPIMPDWLLRLDFPNQRMTNMSNFDNSKNATFQSSPSSLIHRFWSNAKQGHFYTASESEKDSIIASDPSWKYESVAYVAVDSQASQATPVFRFWSNSKQHHFYTTSAAEKDSIIANDPSWSYETVAYYAYTSPLPNTTAVHRFWSNAKQGHFYTTSEAEKSGIIASDPSWKYENIAYYVPTN